MLAKFLSNNSGTTAVTYVDDVFSAYTYTGNGSTQTITNGIDLAGKGGMVWAKQRSSTFGHSIIDSARGITKNLSSAATDAEYTNSDRITALNSSGFSVGASAYHNQNAATYVSWTFRKAPKFFDVVTYTGNGASSRAIAHLLGQEVGMVMTKATSTTGDWNTYHRSATGDMVLNTNAAQTGSKALVNSATTSTFTVSGAANTNGVTYVAYLFAHDTAADGIIQCGSFTTDGSGNATVNLGWEPQYFLTKCLAGVDDWRLLDTARAFNEKTSVQLYANTAAGDTSISTKATPTATGCSLRNSWGLVGTYIYLAIRRPNKPPTSGTQVYNAIARTGTGAVATVAGVGFAPDLVALHSRSAATGGRWEDRLRGATFELVTETTAAETAVGLSVMSFNMDGVLLGTDGDWNTNTATYINHFFKRAVGVFDVVCYTGTGSSGVSREHNLIVPPELVITKSRSAVGDWYVHIPATSTQLGYLNTTAAFSTAGNYSATAATFKTIAENTSVTFVAYLFATKAGISKVGSYTGNGSSLTLNMGFTTGARFFMCKRTNGTGDWYVFDTTRGIIAGNDGHLSLNTTAAEVTTDDSVDPDTSGLIVNQVAATNINVNAATYIYLAFA